MSEELTALPATEELRRLNNFLASPDVQTILHAAATADSSDIKTILHDLAALLRRLLPNLGVEMETKHEAMLHEAVAAGIPWLTILGWVWEYGKQYVIPLLEIILPLLFAGKITLSQALTSGEQYLAAAVLGQPLPPPPAAPVVVTP